VLERHQEQLNRALGKAEEARQKGLGTDDVLAKVSQATLRYQAVLIEVYERVPEEARPAIERAMEQSMRGHEEALQALSGEKREQIQEEIKTRRQEVFQKAEGARERGLPVPDIRPGPDNPILPLPTDPQIMPSEPGLPTNDLELPTDILPQPPEKIMGQPDLPMSIKFPGKIVYTTDSTADPTPFQKDCAERGGVFNACGSICPPDAEMCATVCAYTCEF